MDLKQVYSIFYEIENKLNDLNARLERIESYIDENIEIKTETKKGEIKKEDEHRRAKAKIKEE